jgi:5-methylthioadenosine/S-adenosylhomocysteine deaminase
MQKVYRAKALVTSNPKREVFFDAFLAVENDKILDVGPWKKRPKKLSVTDFSFGLITPGIFNLHTHLPMTLLRGIAEDHDFETWLFKYIVPIESRWVNPEFVRIGTELALCEAIRSGTTFVSEMYYFESEVAAAIDRMQMRGLAAHHVWDMKAPDCENPEAAFKSVRALHRKYKEHPRVLPGIAPHAPYTCSPETLQEAARLAKELNLRVMTHVAETKKELTDMLTRCEMTPAQYVQKSGLLDCRNVLLAHSVWLTDDDLPLVAKDNITLVLNAQCNAKLASGVPPVSKFLAKKIRFALGTDSAASNNNTDIFEEMNFISKLHHVTEDDLTGLPGPKLFEAVTRDAAEAVGLQDSLGSLEPGKQADFIVIDLRTPHLTPLTNVYAHLVYSVVGGDVDSVFVAGKCLMKNRKILIADEKKIIDRANRLWAKIQKTI